MRKLLLSILSLCTLTSLNAFELQRVILSTNDDPRYIEFWPVVAPLWEAMGLKPTLALIATEECQVDTTIGDVIRFDPLPDVPEYQQAQVIRLLAPAFFPDDICLLSDIDMIPIDRSYFFDWAAPCPESAFLVYRDQVWPECRRFAMCYNAAKGSLYAEVFGISKPEDIPALMRYWYSLGLGWETDELMLYAYITEWEKQGNAVMRCGHGVGQRLDRGDWSIDFENLVIGSYIDCHCPRPYSMYNESIDQIVEKIMANLNNKTYR